MTKIENLKHFHKSMYSGRKQYALRFHVDYIKNNT